MTKPKTCSECEWCAYSWYYNKWCCDKYKHDDDQSILHNDIHRTVNRYCPLEVNNICPLEKE